jgi:hypothetical protein
MRPFFALLSNAMYGDVEGGVATLGVYFWQ